MKEKCLKCGDEIKENISGFCNKCIAKTDTIVGAWMRASLAIENLGKEILKSIRELKKAVCSTWNNLA